MNSADSGILGREVLEHSRLPVVDGDVLHQTRRTVDHSESRDPDSFLFRESAPVVKCFFTQKTDR